MSNAQPPAGRWSWARPVVSLEHGAGVSLAVCFFLGVWIAGLWNLNTTLAFFTTLAVFELQVPLARLVRRRQPEPRLVIWTAIYGLVAAAGAGILWLRVPVLGRIYVVALGALLINLLWVYRKEQKSVLNELVVFAGLSLALPFAFTATAGFMTRGLLGLWLLGTLVLSSAIFTVRLRLFGDAALTKAVTYHITALAILLLLVRVGLLAPALAWTMLIPLVKLALILLYMDRYRRLKITHIGLLETGLAILFALWVVLALPS